MFLIVPNMTKFQGQSDSGVDLSRVRGRHVLTSNSPQFSKAEAIQFVECLAVVKSSATGQAEYLSLHPVCNLFPSIIICTDWSERNVGHALLTGSHVYLTRGPRVCDV